MTISVLRCSLASFCVVICHLPFIFSLDIHIIFSCLAFFTVSVPCFLIFYRKTWTIVKFGSRISHLQIPLSGYGGTSNIILEDQRKQADGYVATLSDIAVRRVSKVCLCVRNTGSRAAFIKAVAFSDVQTRSVMEPSVISLAPSQFVLKERTQEVGECIQLI